MLCFRSKYVILSAIRPILIDHRRFVICKLICVCFFCCFFLLIRLIAFVITSCPVALRFIFIACRLIQPNCLFQYKYQLNIDGTVAAYRFPYLMLGDALVFKQDSDYYEHFYRQMKPNVHYVPLKHDLTDVVQKVKWAKAHDNEVRFVGLLLKRIRLLSLYPDILNLAHLSNRQCMTWSMSGVCFWRTFVYH